MAITPYATFAEFTDVYSVRGVSEGDLTTYWLPYGTIRTNEALGGNFTTPFSSNNETAKDLSIHYAYTGILARQRTGDPVANKVKVEVEERLEQIKQGNQPMALSDGSTIFSNVARSDAWSTTQDFNNTFNQLPPELQRVDPDLIEDLINRID